MDFFLKAVGIIAIMGVLCLGAVIGFIWISWRRIKKSLAAAPLPPATIDLCEDPEPQWLQQDQAAKEIAQLEALGYSRAGTYTVIGIPGVQLLCLWHEQSGAFGCYYNHQAAGNFVDLCANFADGLELTITNAPMGGEMDTRPGTEKIFRSGEPVSELHALLTSRITGKALKQSSATSLKAEFIAAYARDMQWRSAKQGVSESEFQRVAARDGKAYTPEQLSEAFKETKLMELRQWSESAVTEFSKHTNLRVAEWKEFENRMILFRADLHAPAYLEYLTENAELAESQVADLQARLKEGMSLGQLLEAITASTGQSFVRLGEVDSPAKFEIFGIKPAPADDRR